LTDNAQGNLSEKQVEFARNIHAAGVDLLGLINDILDLSKIESGTVTLDVSETTLAGLREQMNRTFAQIAHDKQLKFSIELARDLPKSIYTDDKRLQQIIKNLLSNAFKFTEKGSVRLKISKATEGWNSGNELLNRSGQVLAFRVEDTGIGIPDDKQRLIFEAFQQADGTTSRKYGGTGLGLSISREITRLLGGELQVASKPGAGSLFTLYVPVEFNLAASASVTTPRIAVAARPAPATLQSETGEAVMDDSDEIGPGDSVVLIVEDDPRFAAILLSLARESGFKGVVTAEGSAAPTLARRFSPQAMMLDIGLPDMDGMALLDLLKRMPETRHIPVHVISADDQRGLGLSMGAIGFTHKPVEREAVVSTLAGVRDLAARTERRLALVGAAAETRETLRACFKVLETPNLAAAAAAQGKGKVEGVVVQVAPGAAAALIEAVKGADFLSGPVIAYVPEALEAEEDCALRLALFAGHVRVARTPDQLLDQASLLLHAPIEALPDAARTALARRRRDDPLLCGRRVVVIDDDIRNIFSLASALEEYGVELSYAESGRAGIDLLTQEPMIDAALVDLMMPDMDGYETMAEIRAIARLRDLPLIAVTAKAMKGDRQKCIQAGASDYVSKPVDIDKLISVLRVSIQRAEALRLAGGAAVHRLQPAS
ncbi:MAG: response regulator, partial [Caulobacteraceae bacterium]